MIMRKRVFMCPAVHPYFRAAIDRLDAKADEGADVRVPNPMLLRLFKLYARNREGTLPTKCCCVFENFHYIGTKMK